MQGEPVCATHRINVAQTLSPANLVARGSLEELYKTIWVRARHQDSDLGVQYPVHAWSAAREGTSNKPLSDSGTHRIVAMP